MEDKNFHLYVYAYVDRFIKYVDYPVQNAKIYIENSREEDVYNQAYNKALEDLCEYAINMYDSAGSSTPVGSSDEEDTVC